MHAIGTCIFNKQAGVPLLQISFMLDWRAIVMDRYNCWSPNIIVFHRFIHSWFQNPGVTDPTWQFAFQRHATMYYLENAQHAEDKTHVRNHNLTRVRTTFQRSRSSVVVLLHSMIKFCCYSIAPLSILARIQKLYNCTHLGLMPNSGLTYKPSIDSGCQWWYTVILLETDVILPYSSVKLGCPKGIPRKPQEYWHYGTESSVEILYFPTLQDFFFSGQYWYFHPPMSKLWPLWTKMSRQCKPPSPGSQGITTIVPTQTAPSTLL